MAIILLDTCVIMDLAQPDSEWFEWSASTLERLDAENAFIINPIIYAECSIGFDAIEDVEGLLASLELEIESLPREALFLAGKSFLAYKRKKGQKTNVLPDFFIGAHAAVSGYKLMTRDKGRFSTYFPSVELIIPNH
ncbi:MAG: PIN domain-containing protein [Hahellaceae bacterium]|nr:PIN domain-containing protein [Hahellaceae bacterium]